MNPVYVQGYTYIIFILICMYMNFHTFRMKIHIEAGCFYLCRCIVSRHSLEVQIFMVLFIEKDLECSTLCQAGIVYKKESI